MAVDTEVKPLSKDDQILAVLDHMMRRVYQVEGRSPNYVVYEGDILTLATDTIKADFNPDRWVVWFRTETNATLRVSPGVYAGTTLPAAEISNGRRLVIPALNDTLSLRNTGTATCHYFAVAIGGGAEFDIAGL